MELKCDYKTYEWGKYGIESTVATLIKSVNPEFKLDEQKPYAELWVGTHPNGPSRLKADDLDLKSYIEKHSKVLGENLQDEFGITLPFLFKVLSVRKALSIQAHPNKELARTLHERKADIYKDANHKPELAIALTPFEALCGFRPISEIKNFIRQLPELKAIVGELIFNELTITSETKYHKVLKKLFHAVMNCNPETVATQLSKLLGRMTDLTESTRSYLHAELFERLNSDFPGDVGCFCIYLFNVVTLAPGEAIYLPANEPHAYLSGDCVECMASSDNVIRAGLTPKLKDVDILMEMLNYNCEPPSKKRFQPSREDECTEVYRPPIKDFAVAKITVPPGRATYDLIPRNTASILMIINGKAEIPTGRILNRGSALFIPASEKIGLKVLCGCHPMLMFQAFANV